MKKQLLFNQGYSVQFILVLSFFLLPYSLFAQFTQEVSLGLYDFTGESDSDNQDVNISENTPHANFSKFKRINLVRAPGMNVFSSTGWSMGSLDTTQYLEFTVSAGADYRVHIRRITFNYETDANGPKKIRIARNNESKKFDEYFSEPTTGQEDWGKGEVIVDLNKSVTFRIFGYNANDETGYLQISNLNIHGTLIPNIRFNEFHYAASNTTNPDFIEVIVPKSFTALSAVTLTLYTDVDGDGFGEVYGASTRLNNFISLNESSYDDVNVYYLDIPEGLAAIGGFSLTTPMDLIQFLSYGTAATNGIKAKDEAGNEYISMDVGVTEADDDGLNNSIFFPEGRNKAWTNNESGVNTKGFRNGENNIILPVELLYFSSNKTPQGVLLSWTTATEKNNDYFLVERSNNTDNSFTTIAKILGKGTTQEKQTYQALDERSITGTAYYRLKQVDYDGKFAYSKIIAVKGQLDELSVYPNPATTSIRIAFASPKATTLQLQIYNNTGQLVHREEFVGNNLAQGKSLSLEHLPAGTYFVVLLDNSNRYHKKIIRL